MASHLFFCCFFLAMSQGWCTTMEPEPDMYSTTMEPEPAASSTPSPTPKPTSPPTSTSSPSPSTTQASGNGTTAAATQYQHSIGIEVTLTNISGLTEESLIAQVNQGLQSGGNTASETTIKSVTVDTSLQGLLTPFNYDGYILSFATMCAVDKATVQLKNSTETNYTSHSGATRRLATDTGNFRVIVVKVAGADVVQETGTIIVKIGAQEFTAALTTNNISTAGMSVTMPNPPVPKLVIETKVTTSSASPPTDSELTDAMNSTSLPGVSVIVQSSVTVTVVPSTSPAASTGDPEDSASLASMMTFWIVMCAFLMN